MALGFVSLLTRSESDDLVTCYQQKRKVRGRITVGMIPVVEHVVPTETTPRNCREKI